MSKVDFGFVPCNADLVTEPFVFISYKSENWQQVAVYAKHLHDSGIAVWYDNGIAEGDVWDDRLMQVIAKPNCAMVLFFISSLACSPIIRQETRQARNKDKPIVGVFLEENIDLSALLGEAMSNYITTRESVMAYADTVSVTKDKILGAVRRVIDSRPAEPSGAAAGGSDELASLWQDANFYLDASKFEKSREKSDRARALFTEITEKAPRDYRGWLGLLRCECCSFRLGSSDVPAILREAAKHISYLILAGEYDRTKDDCRKALDLLWTSSLNSLDLRLKTEAIVSRQELESIRRELDEWLAAAASHTLTPYANKRACAILHDIKQLDSKLQMRSERAAAAAEPPAAEPSAGAAADGEAAGKENKRVGRAIFFILLGALVAAVLIGAGICAAALLG